ncbi:LYPLA1 [Symbiodinium sp. KB8]|nr:LYPLA1 [Symbiodinium sp. KB8]
MAVEESDGEDEVVILSNSGSQAHGYMAMKASSTKTGKGSGVMAPRMRRSAASATMRDNPPPGSSTLFTFGQHRGLTYERVVHTYPGYVLWGQREKCPSKNLADFLAWVHEDYIVTDSEPIEVTRREHPLSETPVPVLEQPALSSTGGPSFYVASVVQESNTLDFDLLRSIASRTSKDLPLEVVVPAIDQFRETAEGHFATEPSITRGDLIAYLQEALEDQLPQESLNTSWEIAMRLRRRPLPVHEACAVAGIAPEAGDLAQAARYILNVVLDCIHCGVQTVNLTVIEVKINHEVWVDVQDILDGFVRKVRAAGVVNNCSILVAEPEAARAPGIESYAERFHRECQQMLEEEEAAAAADSAAPSAGAASSAAAPTAMEVDEDSFVVPPALEGWDPMDLAPRPGETAFQAAGRMQLKGRRHTSYVAKWGDPESLTAIMNRASNRAATVEFMSSPAPGAAPPTVVEAAEGTPSYSAPTAKVHYSATGFNAGRDSLPLAPSGIPSKAPPGVPKSKGSVAPVFKPFPAELQQQARIAPVIRPATPPIPAGAPPPLSGPPTKAPAVDAKLIGKLKAEKQALLAENTRLSGCLRETEEVLAETRHHLRDVQFDLEEASRRAYRAERQLDDLRARDRCDDRRDYRDRPDDYADERRLDSRSRVRERSARADSSSHFKIGRTARWGRDTAPDAFRVERARSPSSPPPAYPPPPEEPPLPPPAAPPAGSSAAVGARASAAHGGVRSTTTQPFVSVYDLGDEPWDAPGPTRPNIATGIGAGKGGGKSGTTPTGHLYSGREARDYFRTWTPHEWREFRRMYPRPPGQGKVINIDEEMRSVEIAGIDRTGDAGLGWNRSVNFGAFPDGVLTEMYNILHQKETPAMWIGPYSPTQFRAGDRRRHILCEKHDLKVTCITPHTSPSYQPVGKPKDINPIARLYSHSDVENRDTVSWASEGTVH